MSISTDLKEILLKEVNINLRLQYDGTTGSFDVYYENEFIAHDYELMWMGLGQLDNVDAVRASLEKQIGKRIEDYKSKITFMEKLKL